MNELHKAYNALGLDPGAPFETVKRRYRRLVLVWQPDRMTNADAKREAEQPVLLRPASRTHQEAEAVPNHQDQHKSNGGKKKTRQGSAMQNANEKPQKKPPLEKRLKQHRRRTKNSMLLKTRSSQKLRAKKKFSAGSAPLQ